MESILAWLEKIVSWLLLPNMKPMDFVEILLIAALVYYVITWIQKTRAWVIVKGMVVLVLLWAVASVLKFNVILWIFANTIGVGITALIILFQPELRRVLEQLGQKNIISMNFFSQENKDKRNERFSDEVLNELVRGTFELAKAKTGALIVLEQDVALDEYAQTGIEIDGLVTSQLLINIFEHNTPLHDGAVIVRENRVLSATCYLPLSGNMRLSKDLGTRHRAGVGISEVSDSFTIIVSEETGKVSIAREGNLIYNVDREFLRLKLQEIQKGKEPEVKTKGVLQKLRGKGGNERKADK